MPDFEDALRTAWRQTPYTTPVVGPLKAGIDAYGKYQEAKASKMLGVDVGKEYKDDPRLRRIALDAAARMQAKKDQQDARNKKLAETNRALDRLKELDLSPEEFRRAKEEYLADAGVGPGAIQREASAEAAAESELLAEQRPASFEPEAMPRRQPNQINPYAGTGRFNQFANAAERSHDAFSQGLGEVSEGRSQVYEEARRNAEQQLAAEKELASNKIAVLEHERQLEAEHQERVAQQEKEQKERWERAQRSVDEAAFAAKYWNANPDDARQWLNTVNDPNADDRDRAKAKRNLDRAQETGDGRSVGKKIMAAIGLALTAAAGGDTRTMAEMIKSQIEQDMQSQLSKRDGKQKSLKDTRSKLDILRERFGDENAALNAYKMSELQSAKMEMEKLAVTAGTQQKQAALQQGITDIGREMLGLQQSMVKDQYLMDNQTINTLSSIESQKQSVVNANRKANAELQEASAKGSQWDIPGYTWTGTASKEKHGAVVKKVGATNKLKALISDALVDVEDVGTEVFPTDKAKAMQSKAAQIKLALKDAGSLGALDKGSQEFLDEMVGGSFTGIRTGAVKSRLNAILDQAQLGLDAEVGAYGLTRTSKAKADKYGGQYIE